MVEKRETRGAEGVLDWMEFRATREGLETEGRRDCRVRGDLEVSRLKAEQEADMIQNYLDRVIKRKRE